MVVVVVNLINGSFWWFSPVHCLPPVHCFPRLKSERFLVGSHLSEPTITTANIDITVLIEWSNELAEGSAFVTWLNGLGFDGLDGWSDWLRWPSEPDHWARSSERLQSSTQSEQRISFTVPSQDSNLPDHSVRSLNDIIAVWSFSQIISKWYRTAALMYMKSEWANRRLA
jgi:hypothetical protein